MVRGEYPTATAKDVLTIVKKSFGLLRHGKANDWQDSALRADGAITIASPSDIEASFLEAMGFYMTPDAALDLLKELAKRTGLSLVQVCEEYKRLLAVYVGVSKKDLTDDKLLAEKQFQIFLQCPGAASQPSCAQLANHEVLPPNPRSALGEIEFKRFGGQDRYHLPSIVVEVADQRDGRVQREFDC